MWVLLSVASAARWAAGSVGLRRVVRDVHERDPVGRRDHVVVEHRQRLRRLQRVELVDEERRAEQALLLAREPAEADLVLGRDAELHDLAGDRQVHRRAGAVVVDARAGGDAVDVGADLEHAGRIAAGGLGDDVVVDPLREVVVGLEVQRDRRAGLRGLVELLCRRVGERRRPTVPG